MTAIDQREQPGQTILQDFDQSSTESLSLERNSKGYNWKIRVVKREGEDFQQMLDRLYGINRAMDHEYGRG